MCCFLMSLMILGPRFTMLILWLIPWGRLQMTLAFQGWLLPLLGWLFLPWTTLTYMLAYGLNGIVGFDWVWLGLALIADIATYSGGYYKRREVPYYPAYAP